MALTEKQRQTIVRALDDIEDVLARFEQMTYQTSFESEIEEILTDARKELVSIVGHPMAV